MCNFFNRFVQQRFISARGVRRGTLPIETFSLEEQPARLPLLRSARPRRRSRLPHLVLGGGAGLLQGALHGSRLSWVWVRVQVGEEELERGGSSVRLDFRPHLRSLGLRTLLHRRRSSTTQSERLVLVGQRSTAASNELDREGVDGQPLELRRSSAGQQGGAGGRRRGGVYCFSRFNLSWLALLPSKVGVISLNFILVFTNL